MRVLVTGSREWRDGAAITLALRRAGQDYERSVGFLVSGATPVLVHGDANGADTLAAHAARALGWIVEAYPADWKQHGKKAGPIRNALMVSLGADVCLAFPLPGSIGTWDCIRKAVDAGIPTRIYPPRKDRPEPEGKT